MKKINKICAIFVLMFVFSLSVFAADYALPEDAKIPASSLVIDAINSQAYTGKAITPSVTVKYSETTLTQGTDYTVTYKNNTKVGTATVTVEGMGSYEGTKTTTFKILNNISSASVSGVKTKTYTGSKQTQSLTVKFGKKTLKNGTDYTVSYSNNVNAGTATITITGKGSYAGTKKVTFKISKKSISKFSFSKVKNYTYTGKAIKPGVTVKNGKKTLTKDTDYTVSYKSNTKVGTATITVTGKGNYSGSKKITFKINKRSISSATISGLKSKTYTGSKQTQSLTLTYNGITLKNKTDYTLSYKNNTKAGTATVTITGKGNFKGSVKKTFKINKRSVSDLKISAATSATYTGKAIKPSVTVKYGSKKLKKDTDYTVSYKSNTKVGTATITVTGKGNYTGSKKLTFKINQRSISSATVSGLKNKTYTGGKLTQSLKLKYNGKTLKNGTDYTLSYSNNVKAGTATVTITGKGNFKSTKKLTFKISKRSISGLTFSKVKSQTYTGKAIKPGITVKYGKKALVKDTDYTVSYKSNTKVGTATMTITGKGNYSGTKKITFKINKRSISSATVSGLKSKAYTGKSITQSLTLTYNGITLKNKTDYTISYKNNKSIGTATITITGKGNFSGTKKVTFKIVPKTVSIKSAVATGTSVKVTWDKVSNATGYELYMSKNGAEYTKAATITKNSTLNYTVKNLEDATYSFKVRAYKTVSKTKYYGSYSSVKEATITTKSTGDYIVGKNIEVGTYKVTPINSSKPVIIEEYIAPELYEGLAPGMGFGVYHIEANKGYVTLTSDDVGVTIENGTLEKMDMDNYPENIQTKVSNGMYIVGKDIAPGTYKVTANTGVATVDMLYGLRPSLEQFGNSEDFQNGYIEIEEGQKVVNILNGTLEKINMDEYPVNIQTKVSNGMYIVGKDLEPGIYKISTTEDVEDLYGNIRLYSDDYEYGKWINAHNGYIEITEDTTKINLLCTTLEKVDEISKNIQTTISEDGIYVVGKHVEPGIYKIESKDYQYATTGEYLVSEVTRYSDLTLSYESEIASCYESYGYIEIKSDDYAIGVQGATITKVDLDKIPQNIQTKVQDGVYIVGKDIATGTYKLTSSSNKLDAYVDKFSESYISELSWNYVTGGLYGDGYIEVKEDDYYITVNGGTLEKVDMSNYETNIKDTASYGMYLINKDLAPGTYKVVSEEIYSTIQLLTALDGSEDSKDYVYIENGVSYIEIEEDIYAIQIGYGITIEKFDIDSIPVNIKTTVSDGTYIVGKDLDVGLYKITATDQYECYVEKYSNINMIYENLTGSVVVKSGYIQISDEDKCIKVSNGTITKVDYDELPENIQTTVSNGMYIVGKDIAEGTYKFVGNGMADCWIETYSDFDSSWENMIRSTGGPRGYIEITSEEKVVIIYNGTIEKVDIDELPESPQTTASRGLYLVNKEIKPGIYKIESSDDSYCTVNKYASLDLMNDYIEGTSCINGYIEILESDYLINISGGTITEINVDELPVNPQTTVSDGMYVVGKDIEPGIYRMIANNEWSCGVERYSGFTLSEDFIGSTYHTYGYIEIEETDTLIKVHSGTITKVDIETMQPNLKDSVSSGMYIVGKDIAPGIYRVEGNLENEYDSGIYNLHKFSKVTTDYSEIVDSFWGEYDFIEITETDKVIELLSGTMTKVDITTLPEEPKTTISRNGTYVVGKEIEAGIYKVTPKENYANGYISRLSGVIDIYETNLIEECILYSEEYFEVKEDDVAVHISGVTIEKVDSIPEAVSTMSLDEGTTNVNESEVVEQEEKEQEKSNEEVSIYSEVNIYSEN